MHIGVKNGALKKNKHSEMESAVVWGIHPEAKTKQILNIGGSGSTICTLLL